MLQDTWLQISLSQKLQIAIQIAKYCFMFARIISLKFENATYRDVLKLYLIVNAKLSHLF